MRETTFLRNPMPERHVMLFMCYLCVFSRVTPPGEKGDDAMAFGFVLPAVSLFCLFVRTPFWNETFSILLLQLFCFVVHLLSPSENSETARYTHLRRRKSLPLLEHLQSSTFRVKRINCRFPTPPSQPTQQAIY